MTVSIVIIGLGWIGHREAVLLDRHSDATVVGGVDPDLSARRDFKKDIDASVYETRSEMWEHTDPDAVIIASPNSVHYEQAADSLARGAAVLVEKPFVTDLSEGFELVELADTANRPLHVGYHRRFHPGFRAVRRKLQDQSIGEPVTIACTLGQDWLSPNKDTWRTGEGADSGGILYDTGSHLIEALFWVLDDTPQSVAGFVNSVKDGIDVNCALAATIEVAGRTVPFNITLCGESTGFVPDEQLVIWGTNGRITYRKDHARRSQAEQLRVVTDDNTVTEENTFAEGVDSETLTDRKLTAFLDAVRGSDVNLTTGHDALQVAAFRDAARAAAEEGVSISVPDFYTRVRSEETK